MSRWINILIVLMAPLVAAAGYTPGAWPATNVTGRTTITVGGVSNIAKVWWVMNCWSGVNEKTWALEDGYFDIMADRSGIADIGAHLSTNRRDWTQYILTMKDDALLALVGSYINQNAYGTNWPPATWPTNGWESWTATGIAAAVGAPTNWWTYTNPRGLAQEMQYVHDIINLLKYSLPPQISAQQTQVKSLTYCEKTNDIVTTASSNVFCSFQTDSGLDSAPWPFSFNTCETDISETNLVIGDLEISAEYQIQWHYYVNTDPGQGNQGGGESMAGVDSFAFAYAAESNCPPLNWITYFGNGTPTSCVDEATAPDTLSIWSTIAKTANQAINGTDYARSDYIPGPAIEAPSIQLPLTTLQDIQDGYYYSISERALWKFANIIEWGFEYQ